MKYKTPANEHPANVTALKREYHARVRSARPLPRSVDRAFQELLARSVAKPDEQR